jgi:hypothetical protein
MSNSEKSSFVSKVQEYLNDWEQISRDNGTRLHKTEVNLVATIIDLFGMLGIEPIEVLPKSALTAFGY